MNVCAGYVKLRLNAAQATQQSLNSAILAMLLLSLWCCNVPTVGQECKSLNVSLSVSVAILPRAQTIIEVTMHRVPIDGGDLQRLLARDYPQFKSIKDACATAGPIFGLTAETMRCYASSGVPRRSKAYNKIRARLMQMEQEEATAMVGVQVANRKLLEAIDNQVKAFENAVENLKRLRSGLTG